MFVLIGGNVIENLGMNFGAKKEFYQKKLPPLKLESLDQ